MILVVGTKGGVGTTLVAQELIRATNALGVDLADGQLAARLGRTTWALGAEVYQVGARQRSTFIDDILRRSITLLWTPECGDIAATWAFVQALDQRRPVVMDGGLEPPANLDPLLSAVVIVTQDNDVARWHTTRLQARFPQAAVVLGTREAAREWAAEKSRGA